MFRINSPEASRGPGPEVAPAGLRGVTIALVALLALILLGAGGAQLGGAPKRPAIGRVVVWGGLAMAVTAGVGHLFGAIG